MIEVLEDMPEGVVGVEAVGEVTANDYETVLIPTFETGRGRARSPQRGVRRRRTVHRASRAARCWTTSSGDLPRQGVGEDRARHRRRLDAPPHQGVLVARAEGHEGLPDHRARRGEGLGGWLSDIEMINAVTLVTADMSTSCAFYDALGFESIVGGPDAPFTTYRRRRRLPQRAVRSRARAGARRSGVGSSSGSPTWTRCTNVRSHTGTRPRCHRPTRRGVSATSTCATPTATSSASPSSSPRGESGESVAPVRRVPVDLGQRRHHAVGADPRAGAERAPGDMVEVGRRRGTPDAGTGRARTPRGWGGRRAACG